MTMSFPYRKKWMEEVSAKIRHVLFECPGEERWISSFREGRSPNRFIIETPFGQTFHISLQPVRCGEMRLLRDRDGHVNFYFPSTTSLSSASVRKCFSRFLYRNGRGRITELIIERALELLCRKEIVFSWRYLPPGEQRKKRYDYDMHIFDKHGFLRYIQLEVKTCRAAAEKYHKEHPEKVVVYVGHIIQPLRKGSTSEINRQAERAAWILQQNFEQFLENSGEQI